MLIVISFSNDITLSISTAIGTKHKIMIRRNILIQQLTLVHHLLHNHTTLTQHTKSCLATMRLQPQMTSDPSHILTHHGMFRHAVLRTMTGTSMNDRRKQRRTNKTDPSNMNRWNNLMLVGQVMEISYSLPETLQGISPRWLSNSTPIS